MTKQPKVLAEVDFIIPGASNVSSAEGRRNYTDCQETAQWLGGVEVPTFVLQDLISRALSLPIKFLCFFGDGH